MGYLENGCGLSRLQKTTPFCRFGLCTKGNQQFINYLGKEAHAAETAKENSSPAAMQDTHNKLFYFNSLPSQQSRRILL